MQRWTSKLIYSLKIWIFHEQFKLTDKEKIGLARICISVVKIYLKAWIEAPLVAAAPSKDLKLFKSIQDMPALPMHYQKLFYLNFVSHHII